MKLPEFICCPHCRGGLLPPAGAEANYVCSACGRSFPVVDGVLDALPQDTVERGPGQKLMEAERMVAIYESRWWRASKFFSRFMGITLEEEIALIKRIVAAGENARILDLACGPGIYARAFAKHSPSRQVVGLDLSWPMLRYATGKARGLRLENITFIHADAHDLPLKDSSIDAAVCAGALHLFSDVRRVLSELRRVIRPGGRFAAAAALVRPAAMSRLKAYLDGKFWRIHYFREDELKGLLEEAGFRAAVYHAKGLWMIAGAERKGGQ